MKHEYRVYGPPVYQEQLEDMGMLLGPRKELYWKCSVVPPAALERLKNHAKLSRKVLVVDPGTPQHVIESLLARLNVKLPTLKPRPVSPGVIVEKKRWFNSRQD